MTILLDQKTGVVVTGATQPAFDPDFPWLDKMGKDICRLRLGQRFRRVVHSCADDVSQLVLRINGLVKHNATQTDALERPRIEHLTDDQVRDIYAEFMSVPKMVPQLARLPRSDSNPHDPILNNTEDWYMRMLPGTNNEGYEALLGRDNTIYCWAMDTKTLTLKRPCWRCQRMYGEWYLWGRPEDAESKRSSLKDLNAKDALRYDKKKDSCSYCAETAAAAKIYLLREGKMALV